MILNFFFTEIKLIKSRIKFLINFVKDVSLSKFIFYYFFNNSNSTFREKNLNKYLKENSLIWKKKEKTNNKIILVDLTLSSHPMYAMMSTGVI